MGERKNGLVGVIDNILGTIGLDGAGEELQEIVEDFATRGSPAAIIEGITHLPRPRTIVQPIGDKIRSTLPDLRNPRLPELPRLK